MIVSLRGPSGSGKTHLIYRLLRENGGGEPLWTPHFSKGTPRLPRAFRLGNLYVIGRYSGAACSGADGLYPLKDIVQPLVRHYAKLGLVIVEGLVLSSAVTLWCEVVDTDVARDDNRTTVDVHDVATLVDVVRHVVSLPNRHPLHTQVLW